MLAATRSNDLVRARAIKTATAVTALLALLGCGQPKATETSPTPPSTTEAVDVSALGAGLPSLTQRRVQDLYLVSKALERYHNSNGSYPISKGFQGFVSGAGASLGANWIPELTDIQLPRSPQGEGLAGEYVYKSDGANYKLLAYGTGDCVPFATQTATTDVGGVKVDPKTQHGNSCDAYGIWTEGAADF